MAKKPANPKSKTRPQPEPAQIKAIDRLLEDEDYRGAIGRITPLLRRFPDHGGLHRALVEALDQSGDERAAGLAAFAWAEHRPNSLPAQEALLHFATVLGHLMLAEDTARKARALGGETPGFPIDPNLKEAMLVQPDGSRNGPDVMVRFDIGKLHLEGRDFAGAIHRLEGVEVQPARNNLALALFHLGRAAEALDAFLSNYQADVQNLFALGWATRLRLYQGDEMGALGLCTPLGAAEARRMEDALQQLDALLLLQQNQLAWDAFERASRSDWFEDAAGVGGAALRHYGACAACRLGRADDARWLWESAVAPKRGDGHPGFALARANLDDFPAREGQPGFPVVSDPDQALPITWTRALSTAKGDAAAELDALTAANVYLRALYLGGDENFRGLIAFVLRHRAQRSDPDAARLLRELATLPVGTRDERLGFLGFLRSQGLLGRGEPASYWDGERLREIKVAGTEVYREAKESDLPPDLEALLAEAVTLFNAQRPDEAEARLQAILDRVPDHPVALGNLAAARTMQGRDAEARDLLRRVVDRHPDYLFARCNLARTLIEEGDLEEAERLLDGLAERERLHIQEVFTVYGALAMLYTARGDHDAAKSVLASLEEMVEDEDDERRLAQAKRAVAGLDPMDRFKQVFGDLLKSGPRPGRRRR